MHLQKLITEARARLPLMDMTRKLCRLCLSQKACEVKCELRNVGNRNPNISHG